MYPTIAEAEIRQLVSFIIEVDKLKAVTRKIRLRHVDRHENSAEHSWQITLLALSMAKYADPQVDMTKVISMLLVHDIGEIDTGDTMFFVEGGWDDRKADEREAVKRIFGFLPEETAASFLALWEEFEFGTSAESKFANALDRAMPVLLNLENEGQSWRDNHISYERVISKIAPPIETGFPALWTYLETRLSDAREKGYFGG